MTVTVLFIPTWGTCEGRQFAVPESGTFGQLRLRIQRQCGAPPLLGSALGYLYCDLLPDDRTVSQVGLQNGDLLIVGEFPPAALLGPGVSPCRARVLFGSSRVMLPVLSFADGWKSQTTAHAPQATIGDVKAKALQSLGLTDLSGMRLARLQFVPLPDALRVEEAGVQEDDILVLAVDPCAPSSPHIPASQSRRRHVILTGSAVALVTLVCVGSLAMLQGSNRAEHSQQETARSAPVFSPVRRGATFQMPLGTPPPLVLPGLLPETTPPGDPSATHGGDEPRSATTAQAPAPYQAVRVIERPLRSTHDHQGTKTSPPAKPGVVWEGVPPVARALFKRAEAHERRGELRPAQDAYGRSWQASKNKHWRLPLERLMHLSTRLNDLETADYALAALHRLHRRAKEK